MIAVGITDEKWFRYCRNELDADQVNFWAPTPWNVRSLAPGDRWYFLRKSPVRKIGGYGEFVSYENMTASDAWRRYGDQYGCGTYEEFVERLAHFSGRRSVGGAASESTTIGCVLLRDSVFLDDSDVIDLDEAGVSVPRQVVKFKTFDEDRLASFLPGGIGAGTGKQASPGGSASVRQELGLRRELWETLLAEGGPQGVAPSRLRELGIYGGAQGCWVDKKRTQHLTDDRTGVTVRVLHTGRHYADDLSENEILYHYPRTGRPPARDRLEIEATKAAGRLGLPVFVITQPRRGLRTRDVHLGWVEDWDDDAEWLLISFSDSPAAIPEPEITEETPFNLVEDSTSEEDDGGLTTRAAPVQVSRAPTVRCPLRRMRY